MKLAILGGSFNPVHIGHLYLADTMLSAFDYDRVILIPAYQSPFKPGAEGPSPEDRLEMLAASINADMRLTIDDCEIKRKGVSYTIDTIEQIVKRYRPTGKPALLLGDDLARDFHKWRRAEDIARTTDVVVARRVSAVSDTFPFPCKQLHNEVMQVSSAEIRERIRNNGNWRFLVPSGARIIIEDRGLYGGAPHGVASTPSDALIARVEDAARSSVSCSRFLHSRNTALLASDLCRRFGLDPRAGYLAGISHDICKSLPDKEMIAMAERDGEKISKLEQKKSSLLHARAAAVLLEQRFGIKDADILEAVRLHIGGAMGMSPLAKVVFVADKIEISRDGIASELRDLSETGNLDQLFTAVLDNNVAYLRSQEVDVSEGTLRLLEAMQKR
jgi:nicotinate-nucleotide adenylyltransferase